MYTICKSQKVANTMLIHILPFPSMAMSSCSIFSGGTHSHRGVVILISDGAHALTIMASWLSYFVIEHGL
jgi:hypothetical protein